MVQYKMDLRGHAHRSIEMMVKFSVSQGVHEIAVPTFRPGRYQNGQYMRNMVKWSLRDEHGADVPLERITPSTWTFYSASAHPTEHIITYTLYAGDFSAGSTYVDCDLIFINFPNVALIPVSCAAEPIELMVDLPEGWQAIENANFQDGSVAFSSCDLFFDTPLIAAPSWQTLHYEVADTPFYIHTYPVASDKPDQIIADFRNFTEEQYRVMRGFPFSSYHFVFFTTPDFSYHGVEHHNSTVITLGPAANLWEGDGYRQLLGISSHELFHVWNAKATRPVELSPIDFTREPIFNTGYVIEGVTTYLGDLTLIRSKGYNWTQFAQKMATFIQRHADNDARLIRSVAEASIELWTDGYDLAVPQRMTSIYTEGALVAWMMDVLIRTKSNGKEGVMDVMRELWQKFTYPQGYTSEDYEKLMESYAGPESVQIFKDHVHGVCDFFPRIHETLKALGMRLVTKENDLAFPRYFGIRARKMGGQFQIIRVIPGSPADRAGLVPGWMIAKIDDKPVGDRLSDAFKGMEGPRTISLEIHTPLHHKTLILEPDNERYYPEYTIELRPEADSQARELFKAWCGMDFNRVLQA